MIRLFVSGCFLFVAVAIVAILRLQVVDPTETSDTTRTDETPGRGRFLEEAAGATAVPSRALPRETLRAPSLGPVPSLETSSSPDRTESGYLYVVTDSVPVYSNNSAGGDIVRRLRKGDRVEPGVRVLGADGVWIEVMLDGQISGFVRSENLGRN